MSDYRFKEMSIDPMDIVNDYCDHDSSLQLLVDDIEGWGRTQANEVAEKLGLKCESENTYNNPDLCYHHNNVIQWHILSASPDSIYDENAIFLVEEHGSGDVRGNYLSMKAYKFKKGMTLSDLYCELYVDSDEVEMEA